MKRISLLAGLLLSAAVCHASNYNFLKDAAPIADFTKEDMALFKQTIQEALNDKKDGEKQAWKNDKTGNAGLVNPLMTLDKKDGECRHVRIMNRSKKNIAESKFKFCKQDGKWVAVEMLER